MRAEIFETISPMLTTTGIVLIATAVLLAANRANQGPQKERPTTLILGSRGWAIARTECYAFHREDQYQKLHKTAICGEKIIMYVG